MSILVTRSPAASRRCTRDQGCQHSTRLLPCRAQERPDAENCCVESSADGAVSVEPHGDHAGPLMAVFCTRCGEPNEGDGRFCMSCGAPMPRTIDTSADAPTQRIPVVRDRPRMGRGPWLIVVASVLVVLAAGAAAATATGLVGGGLFAVEPTPVARASDTPVGTTLPLAVAGTPTSAVLPPPTVIPAPLTTPTPTSTPTPSATATPIPPTPTPTRTPLPTVPPRSAAIDRVAQEGYRVADSSTYDERFPLRVLLGSRIGATSDYRAFFFLAERFLGTDTLQPSASPLAVVSHDGSTVTLRYLLYRVADADCCPSGGSTVVRYSWTGDRLVPLDPIPSDNRRDPLSRR